jgi:hypothetical protein
MAGKPPPNGPGHRITTWRVDGLGMTQLAVACLDSACEPLCEVTEPLGPFDTLPEQIERLIGRCHELGGWRAHQLELV